RLDVLCLVGPVGFDGEVGGDAAVFAVGHPAVDGPAEHGDALVSLEGRVGDVRGLDHGAASRGEQDDKSGRDGATHECLLTIRGAARAGPAAAYYAESAAVGKGGSGWNSG